MPIDFSSSEYTELTLKEKRQIAINEYRLCKNDFLYYLQNYAKIRHPNAGLIKMKPFDYQIDAAVPISKSLIYKRSQKSNEEIASYKMKFDYKGWWNKMAEEQIELSRVVPPEVHEYYKSTTQNEKFNLRVDTIVLKSRQTGLSTIFQQLGLWHVNFHPNVYDLILSQTDREAKKFVNSIISSYGLIPNPIRARKLTSNEHEIWTSVSGDKSYKSGIAALPPTADAGRGYDPNMIVLDEFAMYRKADEVWTSISMSVSAGGIIVIISTPKGVGNLYHKIWEATNKSLSISIENNPLFEDEENIDDAALSAFRPSVVHWSQIPKDEFTRRGFSDQMDWYNHMKAKIAVEKGAKAVAQELDLDFLSSGDTISGETINELRKNSLEVVRSDFVVLKNGVRGLIVYEPPQDNAEYIIGVDCGEGVMQDYSVLHVFKIPKDGLTFPSIVAKYSSNTISIRVFMDVIKNTGELYNNAWMNIERNNHGHVLLSYFIGDGKYDANKVFNKYDSVKSEFSNTIKGWQSSGMSRDLLINTVIDYVTSYTSDISIPKDTADEFRTFIQNGTRWEAQSGYHDDHIISLALTILGYKLLPKYKQWLLEHSDAIPSELPDDMMCSSSLIAGVREEVSVQKKMAQEQAAAHSSFLQSKEVDVEKIKRELLNKSVDEIQEKRPVHFKNERIYKNYFSVVIDDEDDEDDEGLHSF